MNFANFNWKAGSFFLLYHLLLFTTLPFYLIHHPPNTALLLGTGIVIVLTGLTLTTLYHRYYSHRSYSLRTPAQAVLLFFGTLIAQGSVWDWAFDHRRHHKHVETDKDPHAITRGFWHAHVLWIFDKRPALDTRVIHDLIESPMLRFQHQHYTLLLIISSIATSLFLGWISGDWFGGFYMGFLVRIFISHHSTFCINSLAHYWGTKPYAPEQTAVNNPLCSLITFGEGMHNYHHVFPYDYRIGDRWYYWDPGKWFIWSLEKVGLASRLKRAPANRVHKLEQRPPANARYDHTTSTP